MQARHRRAIGIAVTGLYLMVYIYFAASIGGAFAQKSFGAQMAFFAVAGLVWVFPLYPLFKWMRVPDDHELSPEPPPSVSQIRRGGR